MGRFPHSVMLRVTRQLRWAAGNTQEHESLWTIGTHSMVAEVVGIGRNSVANVCRQKILIDQ